MGLFYAKAKNNKKIGLRNRRRKLFFQQFGRRQTFLSIFHVKRSFKLCIISLNGSTEQPIHVKVEIKAI